MRSKYNKSKIKATGLVEMIVVLGILSVTMVSVVGVTIRSMRLVKKDEIEDRAMGFQLRSLELAKSPATLQFSGNPQPGDIKKYYVKTDSTAGPSVIEFIQANSSIDLTISNCDSTSEYFITIPNAAAGDIYCNQIIVEVKTDSGSGKNYYQIKSEMVYKSIDVFLQKELITYRRS